MDNNEFYLLKIISAAIRGKRPAEPKFHPVEWERIFSGAAEHEVHTLIYPSIRMLAPAVQPPPHLFDQWEKGCLILAAKQLHYMNEAYQVLRSLGESNISVIVVKGLLLRELYPYPELRTMGDIDLLIKPEDGARAGAVLEALGYSRNRHTGLVEAFKSGNFLSIELHYALFDPEAYVNLNEFEKQLWVHAKSSTIGGQSVLTLSLEDNLIYLLQHMAKHFRSAGFGLRQLCDVILFIEAHAAEIDWTYFWSTVKQYGYESFIITVFEICRQFLGLQQVPPPSGCESNTADQEAVLMLIEDIFSSGVFGHKNKSRGLSGGITKNLSNNEITGTQPKFESCVSFISNVLFPSYLKLHERYSYARKLPLLLPVAWLHRALFTCFIRYNSPLKAWGIIKNAQGIASERAKLIRKLGL